MKISRTLIIASAMASTEAAAIIKTVRGLGGRDVTLTQAQFDSFHYFAQYSAASYCASNEDDTRGPISCLDDVCPAVAAADAVTVLEFDTGATGSADVFGYVATDPTKSLIVVAFRGSDSIRNWVADVQVDLVDTSICSSCKVHGGFNTGWVERQSAIVAAINSAKTANPTYGIVVTGHSLGAAVATIAGAFLRSVGLSCDIYTFGSPRVGNEAFANYVSTTSQGSTYRITHLNDPVPHLPPGGNLAWLTGYYHISPEFWLSDGTATTENYVMSDVKVCIGINSLECAESVSILSWNGTAHSYYFEDVTACDPAFTYK